MPPKRVGQTVDSVLSTTAETVSALHTVRDWSVNAMNGNLPSTVEKSREMTDTVTQIIIELNRLQDNAHAIKNNLETLLGELSMNTNTLIKLSKGRSKAQSPRPRPQKRL